MSIQFIIFMLYIIVFIFGACIASFMNVVIYRLPHKESIAKGRSKCPNCGKKIAFYDNIPIISYLWLGGKCRKCHQAISKQYILIETLGGLLAILMVWRYDFDIAALSAFLIAMLLLAIAVIDFKTMTIPDSLLVVLAVIALLNIIFIHNITITERLIGLVCVSIPMLLLEITLGAFGMGDIKLMAVAGFLLGWQNTLLAMFIGIILAGIVGIRILIVKKGKEKKMPFGPYLSIGILTALLFGQTIIEGYLKFFGLGG